MRLSPYVREQLRNIEQLAFTRTAPVDELREMNKALRIAAGMELDDLHKSGVGYPLQGVPYDSNTMPGAEYAPLVPQSIQPQVDSLTFSSEDLVISRLFAATGVNSTVFEYVQRESYGEEGTEVFVSETSTAPISKSKFTRKTADVKFMMEVREYTDVANNVGYMGSMGSARAIELADGTLNFLKKKENRYLWANPSLNPLAFRGLFPSIEHLNPAFVVDFRGQLPLPQQINEYITFLRSPPNHARVNTVLTSYETAQAFRDLAIPFSRAVGVNGGSGPFNYNFQNPTFTGGLSLTEVPYLDHQQHPWGQAIGETAKRPPTYTPTLAIVTEASATNKWTAASTGYDVYYWVETHGDGGLSTSGILGRVTRTATTDAVRIRIADGAAEKEGDLSVKWHSVYRYEVVTGGTAPTKKSQFEWVGDYRRNTDNAGATEIFDYNHNLPGTSNILIGEISPRVMQRVTLLDTFMRPLFREMSVLNPFALVSYETLEVKMPNKLLWLKNVPKRA